VINASLDHILIDGTQLSQESHLRKPLNLRSSMAEPHYGHVISTPITLLVNSTR
jgi:hypothetical protein